MFDINSVVTFEKEQCKAFALDAEWILLAVSFNPQIKTKYSHWNVSYFWDKMLIDWLHLSLRYSIWLFSPLIYILYIHQPTILGLSAGV